MTPIIEKLKKLLTHQKSAEAIGSKEEAAAFAERVRELLVKHNLDIAEIELHEAAPKGVDRAPHTVKMPKPVAPWQRYLHGALAKAYMCVGIRLDARPDLVIFVGRADNRAVAAWLFCELCSTAQRLADSEHREWKVRYAFRGSDDTEEMQTESRSFKHSFLQAFASVVAQRLHKAEEEDTGKALVLVSKELVLAMKAVEDQFGETQRVSTKPSKTSSRAGAIAGAEAGRRVSLDARAMNGASERGKLA